MQPISLKGQTLYVIAFVASLSLANACTRNDPNIPKVGKAVRRFNDHFNASQFHEIYSEADQRLRNSIGEVEFTSKLSELFQRHGQIQTSSINGFEDMTRWQRLFPESKPTRFIGFYNHCSVGGFQALFEFDVTGEEAKLLEFDTDIDEHNKKHQH